MDSHTLRVLEFDKVIALVAANTRSVAARERVLALHPAPDRERATKALRLSHEKELALSAGFSRPWELLLDLAPALEPLEAGAGALEPAEFLEIRRQLSHARYVREFFSEHADRFPDSAREIADLVEHPALERRLNQVFDESGEVLDSASPHLRKLRRERDRVRGEVEESLRRLLRSSSTREALQEELVTVRNDRLVIPVKAGRQGQIPGIVHDLSGSAQTVFVEPLATVPLNNRLREITREEKDEIRRIMVELTGEVRDVAADLVLNGRILAAVDLEVATAEFSRDFECTVPYLREDGGVRIVEGRHPLLVASRRSAPEGSGGAVIPLDFTLEGDRQAVIITGPNTGGKTVALKAVGLFTLMAEAGIPVPAREGTEISLFRKVFADIGDGQSIDLDLSTFSAHLVEIARVLREADDSTLVLFDELGAGTDPDEGGALAQAMLEHLLARGARVLATTHHQGLKMVAHQDPRMENASLEFDAEHLRPTYRFRQGIPGASRGLDIAGRLGVPAETLARARALVGQDRMKLDELLADLDRELARAREEGALAEEARRDAEAIREHLAAEEAALRNDVKGRRREAREEAGRIVGEARSLVERLVKEIRTRDADREVVVAARSALGDIETRIRAEEREERAGSRTGETTLRDLRPGDRVRLVHLDREAVVLEPPTGKRVRVESRGLRLEVALEEVARIAASAAAPVSKRRGGMSLAETPESGGLSEVDLRGLTAEEAIEALDRHLDGATLAGCPSVRIIHGKGTGVLRNRVKVFLEKHPQVTSFQLGEWNEGGAGVTVAKLA